MKRSYYLNSRKVLLTASSILMAFIFYSCSTPKSIVKLEPTNGASKWIYGQAVARDSAYGIIYQVGFDRLSDNRYAFDYDITNRSNLPILIDPREFYYNALDTAMNILANGTVTAFDPETEILNIDKDLSASEARKKNNTLLSVVALGVDVATGVITATDKNPHNDNLRTDTFFAVQADNAANQNHIYDLADLRESWEKATIRKTTLEPGYSMKGKVFFPAYPSAAFIELNMPVDSDLVQIPFNQLHIPVY